MKQLLHTLLPVATAATVVAVVVSIVAGRRIALSLPSDMFAEQTPLAGTRTVLRTIAGLSLIALGVALLFLPGPGVVVIAAGGLMLRPSWRRRILRALVTRPRVLRELNAFRRRHGCPEIMLSRDKLSTASG